MFKKLPEPNNKEDYEVILVDDKSKDKSNKIANEFLGIKNFKYIRNKKNIGVAAAQMLLLEKRKVNISLESTQMILYLNILCNIFFFLWNIVKIY